MKECLRFYVAKLILVTLITHIFTNEQFRTQHHWAKEGYIAIERPAPFMIILQHNTMTMTDSHDMCVDIDIDPRNSVKLFVVMHPKAGSLTHSAHILMT